MMKENGFQMENATAEQWAIILRVSCFGTKLDYLCTAVLLLTQFVAHQSFTSRVVQQTVFQVRHYLINDNPGEKPKITFV